ncbi:hypothetical protein CIW54_02560 [Paraburkholderia sp. T12-10]|nr:hypothetical protein CIW54_02560 [Paraburkholderia sp. T12-10]
MRRFGRQSFPWFIAQRLRARRAYGPTIAARRLAVGARSRVTFLVRLVFSGRIKRLREKHSAIAIRAFAVLFARHPNAHGCFIGIR